MGYAIYRQVRNETGYELAFTCGPYDTVKQATEVKEQLEKLSRPNEKGYRQDHKRLARKEYNHQFNVTLKSLEPRKPTELYEVRYRPKINVDTRRAVLYSAPKVA